MDDVRHTPLYSIPECARYLGLPASTLRRWVTPGPSAPDGVANAPEPLVCPAGKPPAALSFTNLAELHILSGLRWDGKLSMWDVLTEIEQSTSQRQYRNPLARSQFAHISPEARLEYDKDGFARRFYPPIRGWPGSKIVMIDPAIAFGRPVIAGSGVRTDVIASRIKAGESLDDVAGDYLLQTHQVEDALHYELAARHRIFL